MKLMVRADGEILTDDMEKVEEFNLYFADIFSFKADLSLNTTK